MVNPALTKMFNHSFHLSNITLIALIMPTAIITGCNSGQGYAFAQLLIKEVLFRYNSYLTVSYDIIGL